jgi:hypothetical protein
MREKKTKNAVKEQMKVKAKGGVRGTLLWGGRESVVLLKVSQDSSARPSHESRVSGTRLGESEAVALDWGSGGLIFRFNYMVT